METTGGKVDRSADAILEDCQNAAALDTTVQAGDGSASGGFCKTFGDSRKLSTSTTMEDGRGDIIIRVGTIGCSAFGYKCAFSVERSCSLWEM
jgi:hypothetical protein